MSVLRFLPAPQSCNLIGHHVNANNFRNRPRKDAIGHHVNANNFRKKRSNAILRQPCFHISLHHSYCLGVIYLSTILLLFSLSKLYRYAYCDRKWITVIMCLSLHWLHSIKIKSKKKSPHKRVQSHSLWQKLILELIQSIILSENK